MLSVAALQGHAFLPLLIFAGVFALIFTELLEKSLLASIGALIIILTGTFTGEAAFASIDFETLGLLLGMMILVEIADKARIFELLSVKILKLTGGSPMLIFSLFLINTLILSSVLNNVTTILIVLPLTVEITRGVGLNSKPFLIGEIVAANIGGLLTLIGDPVNTIIGTAEGIGMLDFLFNLWEPVFLVLVFTFLFIWKRNAENFKTIRKNFLKVLHNMLVLKSVEERFDSIPLKKTFAINASAVLILTIAGFLFSGNIGLSAGVIALIGAVISLAVNYRFIEPKEVLAHVEWQTLFFFAGLFVLVGALEASGILGFIALQIASIPASPAVLIAIILIGTGIISAIVDNVPFVALMIPIMESLKQQPMFADSGNVLWWTLSLGAVIGGMASPYGSSANIVAIATAKKSGVFISNREYLLYSIPISISGLLISYLYIISYEL